MIVLKTCSTTTLLRCAATLIELALYLKHHCKQQAFHCQLQIEPHALLLDELYLWMENFAVRMTHEDKGDINDGRPC